MQLGRLNSEGEVMGKAIAFFEGDMQCSKCNYQFTATVALKSLDDKYHWVTCPRCKDKFQVKMKDEVLLQKKEEFEHVEILKQEDIKQRKQYAAYTATKCGNCGGDCHYGVCPKCNVNNVDYAQPSYEIPKTLRNLLYSTYFFILVYIVIIISETLRTGYLFNTIFRIIIPFAASIGFGFLASSQINSIEKKGFGWCYKCRHDVSPIAKYCIYCGKRAFWHLTKIFYIIFIILIVLVLLLIAFIVAVQPVSLSIENVDYPNSVRGNTVPVEITLKCIGTKVAYAEKIEIEIEGIGIETERFTWHEDIQPRTTSTRSFTVNIIPGSQYYSVRVTVYYDGDVKDDK
jgi:DNA-directed RNA polymerase subunit RPC12/RpoP